METEMIEVKFKPYTVGVHLGCVWTEESLSAWKKLIMKLIEEGRCFVYFYPGEDNVHKTLYCKFPNIIGKVQKLCFVDGKAEVSFNRNFDAKILTPIVLSSEKTFLNPILSYSMDIPSKEISSNIQCSGFHLRLN